MINLIPSKNRRDLINTTYSFVIYQADKSCFHRSYTAGHKSFIAKHFLWQKNLSTGQNVRQIESSWTKTNFDIFCQTNAQCPALFQAFKILKASTLYSDHE